MLFLSCSVLGAASCASALTSAHRPLHSGSGFALFRRAALRYLAEYHVPLSSASVTTPYKRLFFSRRARPADDNGVAIASVLSFSPQAAPSTRSLITLLRSTSPSRTAMRRTHRVCPGHRLAGLSITSCGFVLRLSTRWPRDA